VAFVVTIELFVSRKALLIERKEKEKKGRDVLVFALVLLSQ